MSDLSDKVSTARVALMTALGDNYQQYLDNMKMWFRRKWSKEEFDLNSRRLLTPECTHLHNEFLVAILNKIDTLQPTPSNPMKNSESSSYTSSSRNSRKRKRSSKGGYAERSTFEPYDITEFMEDDPLEYIRPPNAGDDNLPAIPPQRYCVQELFLPDSAFMMGRFLVGAWEVGLMSVEDAVGEYVAVAAQVLLKNIISAIILKRKHYKVTGDGSFYYDVGAPIKDPFIRNTVTRQKIDDIPLELDKEITSPNLMRRNNDETVFLSACEELYPPQRRIITLKDAFRALQDKNIIPSHMVYAINMERLLQMIH